MSDAIPERSQIPVQYKWNQESVFESPEAWDREYEEVLKALPDLAAFRGQLGHGPGMLLQAFEAVQDLLQRAGKLLTYAGMSHNVDTTDPAAAARYSRAQGLMARVMEATAFLKPAILALGQERVEEYLQQKPALEIYRHYFHNLFRQREHLRSAEVEELLGALSEPFSGAAAAARMLSNADLRFPPAVDEQGQEIEVAQGTLGRILTLPDRKARQTAWCGYADAYLAHQNTFAATLATAVKQDAFRARARRYESTLEAALFPNNLPTQVFHNVVQTVRDHFPVWHRYFELRRRALGLEKLAPYDIWAPLTSDPPRVEYEEAVEWICRALAPLGKDYVEVMRRGCLQERWVDVYPNRGKSSGAFSSGSPGTHPFIKMSYNDTVFSMSTLAHELGHSMHSYLAWKHQPFVYSRYSLFAAEVASNFHQAMLRDHLLGQDLPAPLRIAVIEEAMSNFYRYLLVMPVLAAFELEIHTRIERGQAFTAPDLIDLLSRKMAEAYGPAMAVDRARVGIQWATFPHLYMNYYVFQYTTGISAAHALAQRVAQGEPGAAEAYLQFLKAGGSEYPLPLLQRAGVDMRSPEAIEQTFQIMEEMIDQLEVLV
jgi:oligoendopeptidase F